MHRGVGVGGQALGGELEGKEGEGDREGEGEREGVEVGAGGSVAGAATVRRAGPWGAEGVPVGVPAGRCSCSGRSWSRCSRNRASSR